MEGNIMSLRGCCEPRSDLTNRQVKRVIVGGILAILSIAIIFWFYKGSEPVLQKQNQVEEDLVKVLKGGENNWCVIVDYFLLPYIRITDSLGEKWFRVVAVDDSALYVSKHASLAIITGEKKRLLVKTSQNPVDIEGYDTYKEFLERFSGKCGEKMKNFCKKHKLPYGKIKEICCDN